MSTATRPETAAYRLDPGEGEELWIVGDTMRIVATAARTGGALTMIDNLTTPGGGPPPHLRENEDECFQHDIKCREILNQGRGIRLRVLFTLTEYPRDMLVVYAQGYSICQYLVNRGGRQTLICRARPGSSSFERAVYPGSFASSAAAASHSAIRFVTSSSSARSLSASS